MDATKIEQHSSQVPRRSTHWPRSDCDTPRQDRQTCSHKHCEPQLSKPPSFLSVPRTPAFEGPFRAVSIASQQSFAMVAYKYICCPGRIKMGRYKISPLVEIHNGQAFQVTDARPHAHASKGPLLVGAGREGDPLHLQDAAPCTSSLNAKERAHVSIVVPRGDATRGIRPAAPFPRHVQSSLSSPLSNGQASKHTLATQDKTRQSIPWVSQCSHGRVRAMLSSSIRTPLTDKPTSHECLLNRYCQSMSI